jgi:hypothetical protein
MQHLVPMFVFKIYAKKEDNQLLRTIKMLFQHVIPVCYGKTYQGNSTDGNLIKKCNFYINCYVIPPPFTIKKETQCINVDLSDMQIYIFI